MNFRTHDKTAALQWLDRETQQDHRRKIAAAGDRIAAEVRIEVEVLMHLRGGFDDTRRGLISRLARLGFDDVAVLDALDRMLQDGGVVDQGGHLAAGTRP